MDHEDAETIYAKLDELEAGKEKSISLAKQQLTLLKTNTDVIGNSLLNLTTQHNLLAEKTNRFNTIIAETLKNTTNELHHLHIQTSINEIALFVLNELQKIEEKLTTTLLILEALQQQKLSPLMIPAHEFDKLHKQIAHELDTPFDFSLIKSVIKVYSEYIRDRIIIKILIPILEKPYYEVSKTYLLPIPLEDGTFSLLDNIPDYVFHSRFSHKNFELPENKFYTNCMPLNNTFFICKLSEPIRITPGDTNCVQTLLRTKTYEPADCQHRIIKTFGNFLVPMKHENSWLFWIHDKLPLYGQCPNELYTMPLLGAGILKFTQPCIFRLSEYLIPFKGNVRHELHFHQPEKIDVPDMQRYQILQNNPTPIVSNKKFEVVDATELHKTLKTNSKTMDHLENELSQLENINSTHNLHIKFNAVSGSVGMIILIILGMYLQQRFKRNHHQSEVTRRERIPRIEISGPIEIPRRTHLIASMPNISQPPSTVEETGRS